MSYHVGSDSFDGFLTSLFRKYGEKRFKNFVNLSGTQLHASWYSDPIQLFNPNPSGIVKWHTTNTTNATLNIDFMKGSFILTKYSIKSRIDDNGHFPHNLVVEGSNDGKNWILLHHHIGTELYDGKNATFSTIENTQQRFKKFRLIQLDTEHPTDYYFVLNRLDFFGHYIKKCIGTCQWRKSSTMSHIIGFMVMLVR